MTVSYSGNPANSPADEIRFVLGETDITDSYVTDEEIEFALSAASNNIKVATISCCSAILAKLAKEVDYKIGPETVSASDRFSHYETLLKRLKSEQIAFMAAPSADISTDSFIFDVGMHDNV